jgi:hypothetical protein
VDYRDSTIIATNPFSSFVVPDPGMGVTQKVISSPEFVSKEAE